MEAAVDRLLPRPNRTTAKAHDPRRDDTMISDADLYSIAIGFGCVSVVLIVIYHFIEVNVDKAADSGKGVLQGQQAKSQRAMQ